MRLLLLSAVFCASMLSSCVETAFGPVSQNATAPNLNHRGVWVVNEGGFTFGQGTLSFYDGVEDTLYNRVFEAINDRPLGDVFQSIAYDNGKALLVINNSKKIEVVDSATFEQIHTLQLEGSPRQVIAADGKWFVSELYSDRIVVIDPVGYGEITTIETGGWTDGWLEMNGSLYVTVQQIFERNVPGAPKGLLRIDPGAMEVTGFLALPQGANSLVRDKNDKIWVLCDGGIGEETGGLFRIHPETMALEQSLYFPSVNFSANTLRINAAGEQLYYIFSDPADGVNAFDIYSTTIVADALPDIPWLDGGGLYIYGFLLDEPGGVFYFTDAVGLLQEGFLYKYDLSDRSFMAKYTAGIFPSALYLR